MFDESYIDDTRSLILKKISKELDIKEKDIRNIKSFKNNEATGFTFLPNKKYKYIYETGKLEGMK